MSSSQNMRLASMSPFVMESKLRKAAQSCSLPLHWVLGLLIHEISRERVPVCGLRYGRTAAIIFGIYRHLPHGCRGYGRLPVLGADVCYASVSVKVRV
jgi:hypothetical protein